MENSMAQSFLDGTSGGLLGFNGYTFDDIDTASQRIVVASVVEHSVFATDERRSNTVTDEKPAIDAAPPLPPLDWPYTPATEVSKDGNARCVTKFIPAPPEERPSNTRPSLKVCLKRTVAIFPGTVEENDAFLVSPRKREHMKVMAGDFHQYSHDIEELRRRQVVPQSPPAETKPADTSYKSRYRLRCEMPAEQRDEWGHLGDAPQWGSTNEAGLHQVWIPAAPTTTRIPQEHRSVLDVTRVARSNSPAARAPEANLQCSERSRGTSQDGSRKTDLRSPRSSRPSSQGRRARGMPDCQRGTSAEPAVQIINRTARSPLASSALPPLPRKVGPSRL